MAKSAETTPAAYLASLPPDRRKVVAAVRAVVKKHLPKGYVETINWGMLAYEIPLARYAKTYNKRPLMYVGLAARKDSYSLHLPQVYGVPALKEKLVAGYAASGKKLDMGKGCVHFKSLDEVALDVIGEIVASTSVERLIEHAEAVKQSRK